MIIVRARTQSESGTATTDGEPALARECGCPGYGKDFDDLYAYDGLYQLKDFDRGDLNSNKDAIVAGTMDFGRNGSSTPRATGRTSKRIPTVMPSGTLTSRGPTTKLAKF